MSVFYKVIRKKNPVKKDEPGKYYANAMVTGIVTIDKLAQRISRASTASRGDVQLVISALVDEIIESLEEGNSVRLGDLGAMRISLSSDGATEAGKVTADHIRKAKIIFTPSVMLKDRIHRIGFSQWTEPKKADDTTPPKPPTPPVDPDGGDDGSYE